MGRGALVAAGLALATVVAYWPGLDGQFLNWDDVTYITDRPEIRTFGWATVDWAFTSFEFSNWHPLTWLSFAVDHALYGLDPYGYHVTSLVLHVLNVVLLFGALRALTGAFWRSAAVAALFALHPLHVESVAWVSERKDVLSGFFAILTLGAYARYARSGSARDYALVALAFALALMSKSMVVTLPFVLLLLDVWPLERLAWPVQAWRVVWEKVPLLLMVAGTSALTYAAQQAGGSVEIDPIALHERIANAVLSYGKYLALTFWPLSLSPWYSHPSLEGPGFSALAVGASALVLVGITAGALLWFRRGAPVLVGWLWFVGMLVPVIGLVQIGRQGMADRYTYLPHIGLFVAVVWTIGALPLWQRTSARQVGAVAVGALLLVLGVLSWQQTSVWHDTETLWTYTAEVNPYSFIAQQAAAGQWMRDGDYDRALEAYRRAAEIRPDVPLVHARIGNLLARRGERDAAIESYRAALAIRDTSFPNHGELAELLLARGDFEEARRHAERALELQPAFAEAHNTLGNVWMAEGRPELAVESFRAALRVRRNFPAAQRNLERAEAALGSGMSVAP